MKYTEAHGNDSTAHAWLALMLAASLAGSVSRWMIAALTRPVGLSTKDDTADMSYTVAFVST